MLIKAKKSQTVTEYAILLGVIIAAVAGMQVYLRRGLQARVKSGTDAITSVEATDADFQVGNFSTNFTALAQYEPYYHESVGETYQESVKQEHMGGGGIVQEIVSQISASAAGGHRGERAGRATQQDRDRLWTGDSE